MANKTPSKPTKSPMQLAALAIPNFALHLFYVLLNVPLHGSQSRARNRIGLMVKNQINKIEDARIEILESLANKDEHGKPKRKGEGATEEYDITPDNLKKYQIEFDALMKEKFVIDLLPSVKPDVISIRPLILESRIPVETADGYTYEEICRAFEAI